jgi:hypothetical protein
MTLTPEQQIELDAKVAKDKARGPHFCSHCKREINLDSEDVYSARDGRFWCNRWCMSRPVTT